MRNDPPLLYPTRFRSAIEWIEHLGFGAILLLDGLLILASFGLFSPAVSLHYCRWVRRRDLVRRLRKLAKHIENRNNHSE